MLHHPALRLAARDVVAGTGVRTEARHARGDFLGFYTGELVRDGPAYDGLGLHASAVSFDIVGTDHLVVRRDERDLIGFVNEPPPGRRANCVAVPLHLPHGNAVGYYAAEDIPPVSELWVHYGGEFARDYAVGAPAAGVPRRLQRADAVVAPEALANLPLYCAPRRAAPPTRRKKSRVDGKPRPARFGHHMDVITKVVTL